ncbi:MAG TPA: SPOR domain-containing protein [Gemmatimonadaceae bacterium]|nr:SPOR domain-containing protein [Gemmatimonadaceae bacterium]
MPSTPERAAAWEAEGRRLAAALNDVAAVVVAGHDVETAAHVALGIAAAQSARRRVALGDLTGRAEPLQRLVAPQITDEDPHGLGDVFAYGVSLNRAARQLDEEGRLYVIPAGIEPPAPDDLASDRWRRIADGFRDVGALLLVVAPADTPRLADLATRLDGVVAADHGADVQALPRVIATVETPDRALPLAGGAPRRRTATAPPVIAPARRIPPVLLVLGGLALIVALVWIGRRIGMPAAREGNGDAMVPPAAAPGPTGADSADSAVGGAGPDSASTDSAAALEAPPVLNPGDTTRAAAYSVELLLGDEEPARRLYLRRPLNIVSFTIAPVSTDSSLAYRVASGAFTSAATANAMLRQLRSGGTLAVTGGRVVRLPYAVQLESGVTRDSLRLVLNRFRAREIAAYALEQRNGRSYIYVGAFATPTEARALLADLQAAGVPAALAVRIGRPL